MLQEMELQNFRTGRHLYSAGRPTRRKSARILVFSYFYPFYCIFRTTYTILERHELPPSFPRLRRYRRLTRVGPRTTTAANNISRPLGIRQSRRQTAERMVDAVNMSAVSADARASTLPRAHATPASDLAHTAKDDRLLCKALEHL